MARNTAIVLLLMGCIACGGGGGGGGGGGAPDAGSAALLLTAGLTQIDPGATDDWSSSVDLGRLGLGAVDAVYDLTTPAGMPFSMDVVSRGEGNTGSVRVSLAHAEDGGLSPAGGAESIAASGMVPSASGVTANGLWLDASGDGFARISLGGAVTKEQIIAVKAEGSEGVETALVRLKIGPESEINTATRPGGDYPDVLMEETLYSSDSWLFGLPTIAVSGDRTSIVCYEGDRVDPRRFERYEMRLQHDDATGAVTGGASEETSPDSGNWRDHETAALFNVLALVRSGTDAVTLSLSFDRGATFAQTETFNAGSAAFGARLAQVSMAADYSLAMIFWRSNRDGSTDLLLVEGRPSALDGFGSPTAFTFDAPSVIRHETGDVSPLLMEAAWSEGGDLVIGYGFSKFSSDNEGNWRSLTQNRVAIRLFGGTFTEKLVDEDLIVGKDPSVSLLQSGQALRIFYAYESREGVTLAVSDDAGGSFRTEFALGDQTGHTPTVIARRQGQAVRVDLLFLSMAQEGTELHLVHWDDFDATAPAEYRLTRAILTESGNLPPDTPVPGILGDAPRPDSGYRLTQVAWFGYDAVLDGDDVVVVYDEETFDAWIFCWGAPGIGGPEPPFAGGAEDANSGFVPAEPPPLAPGLTEPVPPPDPDHMHQLRMIRLD